MSAPSSYPVTIYAARAKGWAGWTFGEKALSPHAIMLQFPQRDLQFRVVSSGVGVARDDKGHPLLWLAEGTNSPYYVLETMGWVYDPMSNCWRAPEEMPPFPHTHSASAMRVDVFGEAPRAGWWGLRIRIDDVEIVISVSNVFDPVGALLNWMLRVARRDNAQVWIDGEGRYWDIRAYSGHERKIRLVVDRWRADEERLADVWVDREGLVSSFFHCVAAFLGHPLFDQEWHGGWEKEEGFRRSYRLEETRAALKVLGYPV